MLSDIGYLPQQNVKVKEMHFREVRIFSDHARHQTGTILGKKKHSTGGYG